MALAAELRGPAEGPVPPRYRHREEESSCLEELVLIARNVSKPDYPVTTAIRHLRQKGIPFKPHHYLYEEHGGTRASARALNVPEHLVIKTLVMETDGGDPLIVLMHGDREVSTRALARTLGVKRVEPCDPRTAHRHTGYDFGGTSPFGTRRKLPIFVQRTILSLSRIYINGGKRGFLVEMNPSHLSSALEFVEVDVAVSDIG